MMRSFGTCDKCGKTIISRPKEEVLMLRATHVKMETETFRMQYTLCDECSRKFEKWIINKGDDSV